MFNSNINFEPPNKEKFLNKLIEIGKAKNMKFGEMLEFILSGNKRACRSGWNGKGLWIYMEVEKTIKSEVLREPIRSWLNSDMMVLSHINLKMVNGKIMIGWTPDGADMIANDWEILP
jgi:hypothetical protein